MNKDVRITVRLTPEQYSSISSRAAKAQIAPSAYIRAAAMRHKVVVLDGLKEVTYELKGIGRNLNQLTLLANQNRITAVRLEDTVAALGKIYDRLGALAGCEKR